MSLKHLTNGSEIIKRHASDEKGIVFCNFKAYNDILEQACKKNGIKVGRYDGSLTPKNRQKSIDLFKDQEDPDSPQVMLITYATGDTSLNLTCANFVCSIYLLYTPGRP